MEKENQEETVQTEEKQEEEPAEAVETEEELEEEAEEAEEALEEEEKPTPAEEAGAVEKKEEMPAKEEAKPPPEEEKVEEEIVEERTYTVPLGKAWIVPPNKRTARAVRIVRSFMIKHMKLEQARKEGEAEEEEEPKRLIITNEVNEKMWERGIEKPPRKIRVRAAKDKEGNVTVYLAEGD